MKYKIYTKNELSLIIENHTLWLQDRSKGERADLRFADLSSADLSSANLLIFQYQRNAAYFTMDGTMRIGCECMPISECMIGFKEIGREHGYSAEEIEAYGNFIKMCANKFKEQTNK